MELIEWTSRNAIVCDKHTIKIAKIKLKIFLQVFKILNHSIKIWLDFKQIKERLINHLKECFNINLDNIKSNIREHQLWNKYPEIVIKTKLSVLWIINIQETWKIISTEENDLLWKLMIDFSTNHNNIVREWHTFYEWWNFAKDKDWKIKLVDAWSNTMNNTLEVEWGNILKALSNL